MVLVYCRIISQTQGLRALCDIKLIYFLNV